MSDPLVLQITENVLATFFENSLETNITLVSILDKILKTNQDSYKIMKIYANQIFPRAEYILESRVKLNPNIEDA